MLEPHTARAQVMESVVAGEGQTKDKQGRGMAAAPWLAIALAQHKNSDDSSAKPSK